MSIESTRTHHKNREAEASHDPGEADAPSPLLAQAQAWVDIARAAHENCVKGEEAERVLHQRRNSSGQ
jgi:hypothetical protein